MNLRELILSIHLFGGLSNDIHSGFIPPVRTIGFFLPTSNEFSDNKWRPVDNIIIKSPVVVFTEFPLIKFDGVFDIVFVHVTDLQSFVSKTLLM